MTHFGWEAVLWVKLEKMVPSPAPLSHPVLVLMWPPEPFTCCHFHATTRDVPFDEMGDMISSYLYNVPEKIQQKTRKRLQIESKLYFHKREKSIQIDPSSTALIDVFLNTIRQRLQKYLIEFHENRERF